MRTDLCQGHAQCNAQAPEIYPLDSDGFVGIPSDTPVPAAQEPAARLGAAACPERALQVT
ncbi:ferredoxin [Cryptosporangium aurantiacum]|uniref:ferredoxin n=1 Tax=Cryptosporangium aurantiacum TaxID=134849 RepID=UPI001C49D090|nr:ferredoxin [Cryptosporangium aurantiacum]